MPKSSTKYQASYELIYPWIAPDPKINTNALYIWCKTVINIASIGKSALQSHVKSKKHESIVANREKSTLMNLLIQRKEGHSAQSVITANRSSNFGLAESLQGILIFYSHYI